MIQARAILRVYPSLQHLLAVYNDETRSEEEKEGLLATTFGARSELNLSKRIYTIFSSLDPEQIV